jgi:hypothetical protein
MATGVGLPDRILTTVKESIDPELLAIERLEHYFSIESRSAYAENREPEHVECATHDIGEEKLYRIVSRHRIKDEELARMMDKPWRVGQRYSEAGLTWLHRQEWPQAFPRFEKGKSLPGDVEIADNLFDLGLAEGVISSMEMSCRMGRNVARKLAADVRVEASSSSDHIEL